MLRLKVIKKEGIDYKLIDSQNKEYNLTLEFFDVEKDILSENEYINISAEILNDKYASYTTHLIFGNLDNICGRKDAKLGDIDVVSLEKEGKEIYLKRLYG